MPNRSSPRVVTIAAVALLLAFGSAYAGETLHPNKDQAPKAEPFDVAPPLFHLIHCADVLGNSPCAPDPAMQRPSGSPRREQSVSPLVDPRFTPAR
jgi:hypothetical protein